MRFAKGVKMSNQNSTPCKIEEQNLVCRMGLGRGFLRSVNGFWHCSSGMQCGAAA